MTSGRLIAIGLVAIALFGGATVFYLDGFYHYQRVTQVRSVAIGGQSFEVADYDGLDNPALPLRLRGCFRLIDPDAARAAGAPLDNVEPFGAPFWFECWDAAEIDADLQSGAASAVLAETAGSGDFVTQRIVVIYPDGRAYQWRRLESDAR